MNRATETFRFPQSAIRNSPFLTHPVFNTHHTETEMLRYLRRLESRDLSLTTSMIPLGSCTMKLNATAEMFPISWPEFAKLHPFAPDEQTIGYREMCDQLGRLARRNHRLCGGLAATERRLAGRIRRPARDPRISRLARRSASQDLPHSDFRARHQSGERGHGRIQGRAGGLPERWRHRSGRSAREGRYAQRRSRRADGHLSVHAWRLRDDDPRDLRNRSCARRPGLHGWREHERAGRPLPSRATSARMSAI